jgi:prepilin-type processing-associated H-X9-DG protein
VPPLLQNFFFATKSSQLTVPGPSESWVFTDERPDAIDDARLYTDPFAVTGIGQFTELPGSEHGGACGLTFADGHSEVHKWKDSRTLHKINYTTSGATRVNISGTASPDLAWMAQRTPRAK